MIEAFQPMSVDTPIKYQLATFDILCDFFSHMSSIDIKIYLIY